MKRFAQSAVNSRRRGIEAGQRIQRCRFEANALLAGKRQIDAKVGAAFVQRTRRTKERRDRKLDQAALTILPLVVDALNVMAGIAFVAAELDRAVYEDGQIGVDLDQTLITALVPIVGAQLWRVTNSILTCSLAGNCI